MESPPGLEIVYRWSFRLGVGLIGAVALGGLASSLVRQRALPGLAQDPLAAARDALGRDTKRAIREYRMAASVERGRLDILLGASEGLARAGDFPGATAVLTRAAAFDPKGSAIRTGEGWILLWQGRVEEAERAFREALAANPKEARAEAGLGEAHLEANRFAEAQRAFLRALALDPSDMSVRNSLGMAYALAGQYDEAIAVFSEILRRAPDEGVRANLERARADRARRDAALPGDAP